MTDANSIAEGIVLALGYIVLGSAVLWFMFYVMLGFIVDGVYDSRTKASIMRSSHCKKWIADHPGNGYRDYRKAVTQANNEWLDAHPWC